MQSIPSCARAPGALCCLSEILIHHRFSLMRYHRSGRIFSHHPYQSSCIFAVLRCSSFIVYYMFKYTFTHFLTSFGLKVKPYLGLILGVFLYLLSTSGSSRIVDERVVVPANSYVEWSMQMYPGQELRVGVSAHADDPKEIEYKVLGLVILDEENFAYYESGDYGNCRGEYQEFIHTNVWHNLDINIRRFSRVHVLLNNKVMVVDRDSPKEADISINILRPHGYLVVPSILLVIVGFYTAYKHYQKELGNVHLHGSDSVSSGKR